MAVINRSTWRCSQKGESNAYKACEAMARPISVIRVDKRDSRLPLERLSERRWKQQVYKLQISDKDHASAATATLWAKNSRWLAAFKTSVLYQSMTSST